jgi:hypothetical protein
MIIHRHMTGPGLCCFRRQTTWRRVWDLLDTEHVGRTTDQSTGGHWRRCTDHDQCGEPCKRAAGGLINKSFSWSRSTCVLPFRGRYRCYICWYQEIKKHMMFFYSELCMVRMGPTHFHTCRCRFSNTRPNE